MQSGLDNKYYSTLQYYGKTKQTGTPVINLEYGSINREPYKV